MNSGASSQRRTRPRQSSLADQVQNLILDRWPAVLSILLIVPVGFYSKFYRGPGSQWVNGSLAGVFYVIFWCLVVFLFSKNWKPRTIAAVVFVCTCIVEFSQMWHPAWLESLRSHFVGAAILGSTFDWTDFPYYAAGSLLGWLWLQWLAAIQVKKTAAH